MSLTTRHRRARLAASLGALVMLASAASAASGASAASAASPAATATSAAPAATARASLTDIENEVMCVSCHEPLALAQSPQAYAERNFVRGLVAQGMTKRQIEQALVTQYGVAVLGRPPASGFNLTVYIIPPAVLLGGIITLAFTLPRWRRRARATAASPLAAGPRLAPADNRRLDDDLARFD